MAEKISNQIKLNLHQVKPLLMEVFQAGLVPMLHSSPGVGKSAIMQQIADEMNLLLLDIRLANYDPVDLNGFPNVNMETKRSSFYPPEDFPLEGDELPVKPEFQRQWDREISKAANMQPDEKKLFLKSLKKRCCYRGWLVFLDELPAAVRATQAAAYKLVYDKKIGKHNLHPNIIMAGAGNLSTDNAISNDSGTAMQSRLMHFEVASDWTCWVPHAEKSGFDHRLIAWARWKKVVNNFDPEHDEYTFQCERTMEFTSKVIIKKPEITKDHTALIAAAMGLGAATEFILFCEVYDKLPKIDDILADPLGTEVPDDAATLYALTGIIGKSLEDSNLDDFLEYITRMPLEFQIITLRNPIQQNENFINNPGIAAWSVKNAKRLNSVV